MIFRKLEERLEKGREEVSLLELECNYINSQIKAYKFQLESIKNEKNKMAKFIPKLIEDGNNI